MSAAGDISILGETETSFNKTITMSKQATLQNVY